MLTVISLNVYSMADIESFTSMLLGTPTIILTLEMRKLFLGEVK